MSSEYPQMAYHIFTTEQCYLYSYTYKKNAEELRITNITTCLVRSAFDEWANRDRKHPKLCFPTSYNNNS